MRIRYTGSDDARDLAVAGGVLVCTRGQWVDVTRTAQETGIAAGHAEIVARSVAELPDWEFDEGKPKKTEAVAPSKDEDK